MTTAPKQTELINLLGAALLDVEAADRWGSVAARDAALVRVRGAVDAYRAWRAQEDAIEAIKEVTGAIRERLSKEPKR